MSASASAVPWLRMDHAGHDLSGWHGAGEPRPSGTTRNGFCNRGGRHRSMSEASPQACGPTLGAGGTMRARWRHDPEGHGRRHQPRRPCGRLTRDPDCAHGRGDAVATIRLAFSSRAAKARVGDRINYFDITCSIRADWPPPFARDAGRRDGRRNWSEWEPPTGAGVRGWRSSRRLTSSITA